MSILPLEHGPVVVGAGRLTFDAVVRCGERVEVIGGQAGGTCGNVLAALAYLGWQAYPLADLGVDDPGDCILCDLARCGVHLDLIDCPVGLETPVVIHRIESTPAGPNHSFTARCPFCDLPLPDYEPVPVERVVDRLSRVPVAQAIFFDRDSAGALQLARHCRANGALVVYEPNYAGPEVDLAAALAVAHVVKVSADVLPGFADALPPGPAAW
ncbi:MAG: hypothetical protein U0736_22405 [Gemmataceae bacterium]